MDKVPDCPNCKGTGEAVNGWPELVWWKGRQVTVCHQCKGAGKV
jgi:DnaJ-class molecular chaperone